MKQPRSSRFRFREFRRDYHARQLDDQPAGIEKPSSEESSTTARQWLRGRHRDYLRAYIRWLRPHRGEVGFVFFFALLTAGIQMIEPLFMRHIIDRILLNTQLDGAARLSRLNTIGLVFLVTVIASNLVNVVKDYRQHLLNVRVMLSLRRALFDRLLHLPLPKLWEMKTGGILSRLTGDIDTTTGLLQMAIISPSISVIRLAIAVIILMRLNWRLALMALAIIPGIMLISFIFARRVRPIYRSLRKDAEQIDGRVGETFSGIRVVRAFRRELHELFEYMVGRHTVVRKEMFARRRELIIWTSWGLLLGIVNVVIMWYGGYLHL
ncbi:MAG TPA: ABC transporter ATP-binding protein, partial [Longimicrobiales bacterium]|nr:ABC transporter ATP-binding protein [Longimicrobiales bacterium]